MFSQDEAIHRRFMKYLVAIVLALGSVCAGAQQYPSKPVRIIVSYVPGGVSDTIARLLSKDLTEAWNTSVIVENRPGAGGNIGTTQCAKSAPDGHTMCIVAVAQAMASRISPNAGFDSLKDFSHVTLVASVPMLLLVHPSLPAQNASELIALAKEAPGDLNYATSGAGAGPHLAMELFKQQAGIDIVMVQYKGGGQAIVDQIAGRVETAFSAAVGVIPYVKDGKLRAIAVSTKERFPVLPNVPSIHESGLKRLRRELVAGPLDAGRRAA